MLLCYLLPTWSFLVLLLPNSVCQTFSTLIWHKWASKQIFKESTNSDTLSCCLMLNPGSLQLLRKRLRICYLEEGVNHYKNCREAVDNYLNSIEGIGISVANAGKYDLGRAEVTAQKIEGWIVCFRQRLYIYLLWVYSVGTGYMIREQYSLFVISYNGPIKFAPRSIRCSYEPRLIFMTNIADYDLQARLGCVGHARFNSMLWLCESFITNSSIICEKRQCITWWARLHDTGVGSVNHLLVFP